jgi:hypothetical protein
MSIDVDPGEEVRIATSPWAPALWYRYLLTLGLYGIWRRRVNFAVTNRRVVVGKGLFRRTERTLPVDRVTSATYSRGLLGAWVALSSDERRIADRIGPMKPKNARSFVRAALGK